MTTKKAATGPSRAVHGCKMPSDRVEGAVFRCGCGGYWRLRIQDGELSIWWPVSAAEIRGAAMSRFEVVQRAGEHELYTATAFEGSIGKIVPLRVEGRRVGEAKLISAEVADDGKAVRLTFDSTGTGNLLDPSDSSGYSFGFNARREVGW